MKGSMAGSTGVVHGPGVHVLHTSHFLCPFLKGLGIGQEAHNSLRAIAAIFTNETQPNSVGVLITSTKNSHA